MYFWLSFNKDNTNVECKPLKDWSGNYNSTSNNNISLFFSNIRTKLYVIHVWMRIHITKNCIHTRIDTNSWRMGHTQHNIVDITSLNYMFCARNDDYRLFLAWCVTSNSALITYVCCPITHTDKHTRYCLLLLFSYIFMKNESGVVSRKTLIEYKFFG